MTTNADLHRRRAAAVPRGWGSLHPIYVERARNAELWDVEGNRYIDLASGIAVVNTGHVHPAVRQAVADQLDHLTHTCFMVTPYEPAVALAERLNRLVPGASEKRTLFVNSGAEAVENAVKIARAATGRQAAIAFDGGFHGRTMMTLALTGKTTPYKLGFGPFPGDVFHAPYPYPFHGVSVADALAGIDRLLRVEVEPERVAAIIVEPVLGEGGFVPAPPEFLQALRRRCDEHGILLIIDEIQTGFARTGELFAHARAGIEADLVTLAKGLAGGFPLAAVTGKAEVMDAPGPGGLGGTYGGSPIGCAAGLAVLDVIEREGLVDRAQRIGAMVADRLERLAERTPAVGEVRGLGAMQAIELVVDRETREPDPELAKAVVATTMERGVLVLSCGVHGNVIRLLPALTIEDELLIEGLDVLEGVVTDLASRTVASV